MTTEKWHEACVRISSKTLSVAEITSMLGMEPTISHEKGTRMSVRNPKSRIRQESVWILESGINSEELFDVHLERLVFFIEEKAEQLQQLRPMSYIDIFCGFFAEEGQGTFHLRAELLKRIMAIIPIDIVIDLYSPLGDLDSE